MLHILPISRQYIIKDGVLLANQNHAIMLVDLHQTTFILGGCRFIIWPV